MPFDVDALRARIPALDSGTAFFDGPGGTQTPAEVADAIADALRAPLANHGTVTAAARAASEIVVGARAAVGDLLGSDPGGIVFGRSMTALAYALANVLAAGWGPGDEVVVSALDHDAHLRPWIQAAERAGARVRWAEFDPATGELPAEAVAAVVSPRTRLVAVTGASNLIGTRPPIPEIARVAHDAGALLSVDAVHLAPHAPVDRVALGADLLFCSPYKFMGPHLGALAADPALLATLHPDKLLPSSDAVPERFELGTLPYESLAGVTAAIDLIASLAGDGATGSRRARLRAAMEAIETHEDGLRAQLEDGIDAAGAAAGVGIVRHARARCRTPTILITLPDRPVEDLALALAARGVNAPAGSFYAIEASRRLGLGEAGGLRIGCAPYTSEQDVAQLLEGLGDHLEG